MSLAPVTWVVISEIFPNRIRGTAMSVAVTALWIACFILTYTFPTQPQQVALRSALSLESDGLKIRLLVKVTQTLMADY